MKNNTFSEIWNALEGKRIAMALHLSPDGDSLGSNTAMKYALEKYNKCKVTIVSPDELSRALLKFPFASEVECSKDISELGDEYEAFVFLDMGSAKRVSKYGSQYQIPKKLTVNIDHHNTNDHYAQLNYVDAGMVSTCSILIEMFKAVGVPFDKELSTRLALGVCTDSNFFAYSTGSLKEVSFLIDHGADYLNLIMQKFRLSTPLYIKKYQALVLNNLVNMGSFAYSTVMFSDIADSGLTPEEANTAIFALQDIEEFDYVFTLVEMSDKIKGSFRARRKSIDVSKFAQAMGGGGHKSAAGFALEKMSMDQAVKRVLQVIEEVGIQKY